LNFIFQKLKILKPYFTPIFGVQIHAKTTEFHSIIFKVDEVILYYARTQIIFHFHNVRTTKQKLLIFDNKQMVKMHKLLEYYKYKNS